MDRINLSEEQRNRLSDDQYSQLEERASLLDTGGWGDSFVSCGGTTWRLHSDILCSSSGYFRAAFNGGFKESEYKLLDLQELVTSYMVWLVIRYIYLSIPEAGYDLEVFGPFNDAQFYGVILELYRHAAFFQVRDLKDAIILELQKRLNDSAMILFRVHRGASDPQLFKRALHDPMTAAVSAFDKSKEYYDFYEPIRSEIFRFVERCYPVLSGMGDDFEDYLHQAPDLGLTILKNMSHIKKSTFIVPGPQVCCTFCNELIYDVSPRRRLYRQPEFGIIADCNGNVKYFCNSSKCFGKIRVNSSFKGK